MENEIVVAVKGIVSFRGRILLVKRSEEDETGAGEWEFPGGKISFGETLEDALKREVYEESGLDIEIEKTAYSTTFLTSPKRQVVIICYLCTSKTDVIELSPEHSEYVWVKPDKLDCFLTDKIMKDVNANYRSISSIASEKYVRVV